ncbi:hypothetical protein [Salipiger abyssi]|uniref:Ankyrin repeat protein n=1 Tax=Salipiger abyssi TaxID=1250539 RepID=A0A1P8UVI9_9RHOB|nr:hypothetical protein [Salipiger abyssi]APZ53409.1 Ankyrin repeat protein [Salipiger abyssi]
MNNLELLALFQAEEDALQKAFHSHGLTKDSTYQKRLETLPRLLRDVLTYPDEVLCAKIADHLAAGVNVDETPSDYGVTAFRLCFGSGKMASMRSLLRAGAKTGWTSNQISLALGQVPKSPKTGKADPFCFACRVGNLAAAQEYLPRFDTGRQKNPDAVIAAVKARATVVVKWLMDLGFDPNAVDEAECEALECAVDNDDVATADALLRAGAAPFGTSNKSYTSPVKKATSNAMRQLFVRYGVNPAFFEYGPSLVSPNFRRLPEVTLKKSDFEAHRTNRPGCSNPEPFLPTFWSERMRDGRYSILEPLGYSPDRSKPVWSFSRYGRTVTMLPDGRLVFVAGEHEDHYDSDFCIYADVTVLGADGTVEHFIYPKDVFPPTDFHTATLVGDQIWLIGCLGYPEQRKDNQTQVLRLSTLDFSVMPVEISGESPGWIHRHRSILTADGILVIGGKVAPDYLDNHTTWLLNLQTLAWQEASASST